MRSADEVPVHHLVVDSGAFIKRAPLQDLGAVIYSVKEVVNELKCEKSRNLLESIPYEIIIREPSKQSLQIVSECSKKTGDYATLSAVDLKVLALTHDLHVEICGKDKLNYDCKRTVAQASTPTNEGSGDVSLEDDAKRSEKSYDALAGFYNPSSANWVKGDSEGKVEEDFEDEEESGSDNEGWLDESNIDENLLQMGAVAVSDKNMKVACITTDFAIQNVLLHMGLALLSVDGYRIRRLNSYILRCRACFATTTQMTRRFCAKCGNDALHRVAVTVDEDGVTQMHINWRRLCSSRGLRYTLPAPKGGKHSNDPQLFEDQRMPQNRAAKCHIDPLDTSPFAMNDVTSRSAILGIRDRTKVVRRNPNAVSRGRKRGGKKR
ncbi:RNA-binding protein NOB1 [Toxocara canis]|uniref:RNA-binding protein NOB1 n=1 Tax=Toxocara canis TaxID=6265 RepID=A0A0B2UNX4_TOXCA|nr:RNA-binding protein NOB1 [Toxocara canis]